MIESGMVRGRRPGTRGFRCWSGRPGAILDATKEREGQAPLRGLGELRPLEVSRQPPDLFPGIRHRGPTRQATAEERTRQPKDNASLGGTGRAEGQETPPRRSKQTRAPRARGRVGRAAAPPTSPGNASTAVGAGRDLLCDLSCESLPGCG